MNRFNFESRRFLLGVCLVLIMGAAATAFAQGEPYLELLRKDLQTEKVAILTEAMELTDEQAEVFWPIYRDYQTKLSEIGDRRIALIKDYAAHYGEISGEKAKELTGKWFKQQNDRLSLWDKTVKKMSKDVDPVVAMRFLQVEHALNLAIDLQVTSELPLIR